MLKVIKNTYLLLKGFITRKYEVTIRKSITNNESK